MEVLDAQFEKAKMCARIGDKAGAYAAYNTIAEKAKISTGKKIDAFMAKTRVALFHLETQEVRFFVFLEFCDFFSIVDGVRFCDRHMHKNITPLGLKCSAVLAVGVDVVIVLFRIFFCVCPW